MRAVRFIGGMLTALALVLAGVAVLGRVLPGAPGPVAAPVAAPAAVDANEAPVTDIAALETLLALIHAQDAGAVEATLRATRADTRKARADQRDVFGLFTMLHPDVDAFTRKWLAADPASPAAMTARGWYLQSLGWAYRGNAFARDIYPPRLAAFRAAHEEGLALMRAAIKADPTLVAASDGVLEMAHTTGNRDLVIPEVSRIMAIAPNRATLIKAAKALSPKWGGSLQDINALCNLYAGEVTDQPGYSTEICQIDAMMSLDLSPGAGREAALAALKANPSPLLDIWRRDQPIVQGDSPATRMAALEKIKETRPLTVMEAELHDQDADQLAVITGTRRAPELPAAFAREVPEAGLWLDRDPGNFDRLTHYDYVVERDRDLNGTPFDRDDLARRYTAHLAVTRFRPEVWRWLGRLNFFNGGEPIDGIERAEPYMINAIVYSNHNRQSLAEAFGMKFPEVFHAMANATPFPDTKRYQRVIQCPMVRQLRLLMARCEAEGMDFSTCTDGMPYETSNMQDFIKDIAYAGACPFETSATLDELFYKPQDVTLTPP